MSNFSMAETKKELSKLNVSNSISNIRIVWAFRNEFGAFFPALEIPKDFAKALKSFVSGAIYFRTSPLLCSSCKWIIGQKLFMFCQRHQKTICGSCFTLLSKSQVRNAPKPTRWMRKDFARESRNFEKNFAEYQSYKTLQKNRKVQRKGLEQNGISTDHLSQMEVVRNPRYNVEKSAQCCPNLQTLNDEHFYLSPQKELLDDLFSSWENITNGSIYYWLDGSGQFEKFKKSQTEESHRAFLFEGSGDFVENLSKLSSKKNQPSLDFEGFNLLSKAVLYALKFLGVIDLKCQEDSVNINYEDCYDNVCYYCREVGDLICCDSCTRVFHLDCAKIREVPVGKWHCSYCIVHSFLGKVRVDLEEKIFGKFDEKSLFGMAKVKNSTTDCFIKTEPRSEFQKMIELSYCVETNRSTEEHFKNTNNNVCNSVFSKDPSIRLCPSFKTFLQDHPNRENNSRFENKRRLKSMDKIAKELIIPNSALNFFLNKKFTFNYAYLLEIPEGYRYPEIDEETGDGGYSDTFKQLNFYRHSFAIRNKHHHLWNAEKVPIVEAQCFLKKLKKNILKDERIIECISVKEKHRKDKAKDSAEKNSPTSAQSSSSENIPKVIKTKSSTSSDVVKTGETKEKCSVGENGNNKQESLVKEERAFKTVKLNGKFIKIPPPPPTTSSSITNTLRKQRNNRFKRIPKKANKIKSIVKKAEQIELDNRLYDTVLTAYTKEAYNNLMKLKVLEMKIEDIEKKLVEAKQKSSRKSVENSELVSKKLFLKNKIDSINNERLFCFPKEKELNVLMSYVKREMECKKTVEEELKKDEESHIPTGSYVEFPHSKQFLFLETDFCERHRQKLIEHNCFDNKSIVKIRKISGVKLENGKLYKKIEWDDNSKKSTWEDCDKFL